MSRVALVTGAARGIGARVVVELARGGWQVVAFDRCGDDGRLPYRLGSAADLAAVVAEAEAAAGAAEGAEGAEGAEAAGVGGPGGPGVVPVLGFEGDAADAGAMEAAVSAAEEAFGGLDAVVAAAGVIGGGVPSWELPEEQEEAILEVDLKAVLVAARVGIPALLRRPAPRSGRFLAVASAAATRGLPMLAAYCAAKAGVVGLVRALAAELAGTGVTANAVSPGSTATPILAESARLYGLASPEAFAAQQPIGRLLRPEEVAAAICFLLGDGAAAVTGANLAVDGGLSV